jgi:hypothetical protein
LHRKSNSNEHRLWRVNRRRLVGLLTVSFGLATASCWSSDFASAPGDAASGNYRLTRFGGQSLPADVGRIVTRSGDTSYTDSCHLLVSGGQAELSAADTTFSIAYETSNSCTGARVGEISLAGIYGISGDSISFVVPAAIPPDYRFAGDVHNGRLVVTFPDNVLEFER